MKLKISKIPTAYILAHIYQGDYSNGPPVVLIHLDKQFTDRVHRIQQILKDNSDVLSDRTACITTDTFSEGVTFITENNTELFLPEDYGNTLAQDYMYMKPPTSTMLKKLKDKEYDSDADNRVDYCYLRVWRDAFGFDGYLKYGEGNDNKFDTVEIPRCVWCPQKSLSLRG